MEIMERNLAMAEAWKQLYEDCQLHINVLEKINAEHEEQLETKELSGSEIAYHMDVIRRNAFKIDSFETIKGWIEKEVAGNG